eukprot:TRINITY_DN96991_c0_g1_i1.p1 TRINITY_DN96991_c0_g1~~TRINITY_DN96991_c0_g1_i1.p1  ORF type:complete len:165 (-),score=40.47 TRINITY_DN96991_c0_g1_i1:7-501(-)
MLQPFWLKHIASLQRSNRSSLSKCRSVEHMSTSKAMMLSALLLEAVLGSKVLPLGQAGLFVGDASQSDTQVTVKKVNMTLGPFESDEAACDYCETSYTKAGDAPAGPIAEECVCMAYKESDGYMMFCATPPSAAGFIADKEGGCTCKIRDMENLGKTTCKRIGD